MRKVLANNGRHISTIITSTICTTHDAGKGDPCFEVLPDSKLVFSGPLSAVCGRRIKRAGYVGRISAMSYTTKRSSGPSDRKPKTYSNKKEA